VGRLYKTDLINSATFLASDSRIELLDRQHIVPPMAAIANAIHAAVGVGLSVLPMSPTHVLEGLWKRES
jgi:hypothetical protein